MYATRASFGYPVAFRRSAMIAVNLTPNWVRRRDLAHLMIQLKQRVVSSDEVPVAEGSGCRKGSWCPG